MKIYSILLPSKITSLIIELSNRLYLPCERTEVGNDGPIMPNLDADSTIFRKRLQRGNLAKIGRSILLLGDLAI